MSTTAPERETLQDLPPTLRLAFAPLIKRGLGIAVGLYLGGGLALLTAYHLVFDPAHVSHLWLLAHYFRGYDPEVWTGVPVGFLWGGWTGFAMGFFLAAARNFLVAVWVLVIRTRANLVANRDFLDHI